MEVVRLRKELVVPVDDTEGIAAFSLLGLAGWLGQVEVFKLLYLAAARADAALYMCADAEQSVVGDDYVVHDFP